MYDSSSRDSGILRKSSSELAQSEISAHSRRAATHESFHKKQTTPVPLPSDASCPLSWVLASFTSLV
jgi:hypothetical protein